MPLRPFTADDLYRHRKITELHCSPTRELAACTVRSIERESDRYVSSIWTFALDGSSPGRQLTRGPGLDKSPRWSPDGEQLAFLSDRAGGASQIHLIEREGGEAHPLSSLPQGATMLRWTPDGGQLIATAAVSVDPDRRGERGAAPPPRSASKVELAWRLPYKSDGPGYLLSREIHLFAIDAKTGEHRQITDGAFDIDGFDVSPDGKRLAYARTRKGRFAHRYDLWVCDIDGGNARQLSSDQASVMHPLWSPDGRWIVFAGAEREGDSQSRLWLVEVATGRVSLLGEEVEVADSESIHWCADSAGLVFARAHRGCHVATSISVAQGRMHALIEREQQFGALAMSGAHLAYAVEAMTEPSELYASALDGSGAKKLSRLNAWWEERMPMQAQLRDFEVPDGRGGKEKIQGWLLRAKDAEGPLPLLNDVHGGPASYALLDFDTNVFWQVLCSQGWAVLALNAVGSSSYGTEFCARLAGHWGEYDLPQHLAAIDQLQAEGLCDQRAAISGKSYGGYLSGWAIGHTQRFKAAVVMAPVGNIETHYGTSDGGYYADPLYMDTGNRFDREVARQLSPLQHVEKARTPTLFLQGKEDERCPKCQSEELFVSLMRAGDTPTELALYPGEGHGFLGEGAPSCRLDAAQRIVDWVTRWCGPGRENAAPEEEMAEANSQEA